MALPVGKQYAASITRRDGTPPFLGDQRIPMFDPERPMNMPSEFTGEFFEFMPGVFMLFCYGVFGGANVNLLLSPDKINILPFKTYNASTIESAVRIEKIFAQWMVTGGDGTTEISAGYTGGHNG